MLGKKPWLGYIEPAKIFGNLYFVGTLPSSVHLIDTGDGLILIDTGYLENLYLTVDNIHRLGFDTKDIKYIVLSHGHYDHANGAAALAHLTGAKIFLGRADAPLVTGEINHFKTHVRPLEPDVLLDDGDEIRLGNTKITCLSTPGHTDGTMSFFFDVTDGENTYRVGTFGGAGTNTLVKDFLISNSLPFENRNKFYESIQRLKRERVDIFIGNHVENNDTQGKLAAMKNSTGNPFIDENAWGEFLASCEIKLKKRMEE